MQGNGYSAIPIRYTGFTNQTKMYPHLIAINVDNMILPISSCVAFPKLSN